MSYYTELKEHERSLQIWVQDKVIVKPALVPLRDIILIHKPEFSLGTGSVTGCNSCAKRVLTKAATDYFELKEHYNQRRKGGKQE